MCPKVAEMGVGWCEFRTGGYSGAISHKWSSVVRISHRWSSAVRILHKWNSVVRISHNVRIPVHFRTEILGRNQKHAFAKCSQK